MLGAILMAALLEGSHFTKPRWELSDKDLNRICHLCLVLFVAAGMLLYSTEDRLVVIFKFAQWMPFCFFPIALAQAYGDRPTIPIRTFSWLLRRVPQSPLARTSFNISYAYYAVCVLSASASTAANDYFYPGVSILILLGLASVRPRRISWQYWIMLSAIVLMCGRLSHQGLKQLQDRMERALGSFIADFFRSKTDQRECVTMIGRGALTLSGKIVLRVHAPAGDIVPGLLREGAYDSYRMGIWTTGSNEFGQAVITTNGIVRLLAAKKTFSRVDISGYFTDGEGFVPIPHGTFEIEDFPGLLQTNRLGVVKVSDGPGLIETHAEYFTGQSMDGLPGAMDKGVPDDEKPVLQELVNTLGLAKMTERQKINAVNHFFKEPTNHFRYSLNPRARTVDQTTPLGTFLRQSRAGHCQYYATATVLLLRQAGVYARYITGYAVPESTRHGETYLVRERHKHAWALVYHSDTQMWEQVDNTPGTAWDDVIDAKPPWWEPGRDFLSNLYYRFSKWRWGKGSLSRYSEWALVPLIVYLLGRIVSTRRRQQKAADGPSGNMAPAWPGMDSELFLINQRLAEMQLARQPHEPLNRWQQRLEEAFPRSETLSDIFLMHRRLRFDPRGLTSQDRATLRRQANEWLAVFSLQFSKQSASEKELTG